MGPAVLTTSPHIPALLEQEVLGAGQQLVQVSGARWGFHWANQGSHVCFPIQSGDRGRLSYSGDCWVLGVSGVSWLRGTESKHSSSKEGEREGMGGEGE